MNNGIILLLNHEDKPMPILIKLKENNPPEIPSEIKNAVQKRLLEAFSEFELPRYHDLALSKTMLDKAVKDGYIIPFLTENTDTYIDALVKKSLEYTKILDLQDKLPEIIAEHLTKASYGGL